MPDALHPSPNHPDDWFSARRFAIFLGLLLLVCFPMVFAGQEAFAYLDSGQFAYPVAFHHRESFWRGELPLWNPYNSCGIPFLAQWNTLTLYPPSLFYLLLPMPWSFNVFCLGHLFFAGMGMYFLARRWTGHQLAAAVAGTIFAFNGLTWCGLMWPHLIAALSWMPWIVLAVERAWRDGGRAIIWAALACAAQLLSGGAEVIIQTWLFLSALWLLQLFRREIPRWPLTSRLLLIGLIAAGLAAAQILPFLDLLCHSQRDTGYSASGMGSIAAMPPTGFFNYLVPLFHYVRNPQGIFVQVGQSWTASYYLGATAVVLAVVAAWRVRNARVILLSILSVLSLLLALGHRGLLLDLIRPVLPILSFVRFPVKFLFLATFTVPLLAAYGLNWLHSLAPEQWVREKKKLACLLVGVMIAIVAIIWVAAQHPVVNDEVSVVARNAAVRVLFLALIIGCIVLLHQDLQPRQRRLIQTVLPALFWFDVFTHSSNLSPTVSAQTLAPGAVQSFFKWEPPLALGASRAMQSKDSLWLMLSQGTPNLDVDVNTRRLGLFMNYNLLDAAPKFDGFYSLDIREYYDLFKHLYFTTNEAVGLKDFLGIAHTNPATNAVAWQARPSARPLVTAGQATVFAESEIMLHTVKSEQFNPAQMVFLSPEVRDQVSVTEKTDAKVSGVNFSTHRVEFDVDASSAAMAVIAQTFYHPWKAFVDDKPVELFRANYAFQALQVTSGKHHVRLQYHDAAFRWGAIISALTLAISAACLVLRRSTQREPST